MCLCFTFPPRLCSHLLTEIWTRLKPNMLFESPLPGAHDMSNMGKRKVHFDRLDGPWRRESRPVPRISWCTCHGTMLQTARAPVALSRLRVSCLSSGAGEALRCSGSGGNSAASFQTSPISADFSIENWFQGVLRFQLQQNGSNMPRNPPKLHLGYPREFVCESRSESTCNLRWIKSKQNCKFSHFVGILFSNLNRLSGPCRTRRTRRHGLEMA